MAEPTLNSPRWNTFLVVHRCERLSETMQTPVVAYRFVFAAPTGTVVAASTIESSPMGETLECTEHVGVRLAVRQGKDEARVGIPLPTSLEQGNQRVWNRD